jgi:erythrocyte band 7 integral membrane protein
VSTLIILNWNSYSFFSRPAQNQTVQQQLAEADRHGEGPSSYQDYGTNSNNGSNEFAGNTQGFQNAVNARVVENM